MMQYTASHEWIMIDEKKVGTVGITGYAVKELGEVVYVQLPSIGAHFSKGQEIAVLESTKAAVDIYAPLEGVVISVNPLLLTDLHSLNESPETLGWLFKLQISPQEDLSGLLTEEEYRLMVHS